MRSSRDTPKIGVEELRPGSGQTKLEVLRLLATRLSRREIAGRLYVSLNTVKSHQRAGVPQAPRRALQRRGQPGAELGLL
ncbi:LuxR C-terminal-related transcriptional regulator [Mycobacterium sp. E2479]|uniref:LuxR C-terminal-related transcriptional regulator n=1 Tax=Mycobacterium sp. E2479 TaxID=1834134 RepID=UPI001E5FA5EF|nr:LuxR C-terminal-related transcriptional regulator [Mycobacterium sp. E2479]